MTATTLSIDPVVLLNTRGSGRVVLYDTRGQFINLYMCVCLIVMGCVSSWIELLDHLGLRGEDDHDEVLQCMQGKLETGLMVRKGDDPSIMGKLRRPNFRY